MAQAPVSSGDGYEVIPASRRPDGTWRKEIKIKSGYVPPDEIAKYESKGKRFLNEQPTLPPGYTPPTGGETKKLTKNQKKNERKRQQRKEKSEIFQNPSSSIEKGVADLKINSSDTKLTYDQCKNPELLKKIRAVRKKLKHCEQLETKRANGETLEKEQIEKLCKKKEFYDELLELESQVES